MSEFDGNTDLVAQAVAEQQAAEQHYTVRQKALALVLSGTMLVGAACGTEHRRSSSSTSPTTIEAAAAASACGEINTGANAADTNYGSPESIFPSLATVDKATGKDTPFTAEQASQALVKQVSEDVRVLGIMSAFVTELRDKQQLPDTGTLSRAEKLIADYESNPKDALDAETKVCAALAPMFLTHTDSFAITRGQAMGVFTERAQDKGAITGFDTQVLNATENLSGWTIGYNQDDTSLSDVQKAIFEKLSKLMVITDDGRFIVNMTFGPSSFNLSNIDVKHPVSIKVGGNQVVTIQPMPNGETQIQAGGANGGGNISAGQQPEQLSGPLNGNSTGPNANGQPEATTGNGATSQGGGGNGGGQGGTSTTETTTSGTSNTTVTPTTSSPPTTSAPTTSPTTAPTPSSSSTSSPPTTAYKQPAPSTTVPGWGA